MAASSNIKEKCMNLEWELRYLCEELDRNPLVGLLDETVEDVSAAAERLEVAQGLSRIESTNRLERVEDQAEELSNRLCAIDAKVASMEKYQDALSGCLTWPIRVEEMDIRDSNQKLARKMTFHEGHNTWEFCLKLIPRGRGVGKGRYMSLIVEVDTKFALSSICSTCQLKVLLRNSDQVNGPCDARRPREDYSVIIEPGQLKRNRPIIFETFIPHEALAPNSGFLFDSKFILIVANAESVRSTNRVCEDWLGNNYECEPLGNMD